MLSGQHSPSRTITLLNSKTVGMRAALKSRSVPGAVRGPARRLDKIGPQETNSAAVAGSIEQLTSTLQDARMQAKAADDGQAKNAFQLADLLPVSLQGQQQQQQSQEDGEDQEVDVFNAAMPMAEKIRILRARPELLRRFIADAEGARAGEVKLRRKEVLEKRIEQRKALGCAYLPLVGNFEAFNKAAAGAILGAAALQQARADR